MQIHGSHLLQRQPATAAPTPPHRTPVSQIHADQLTKSSLSHSSRSFLPACPSLPVHPVLDSTAAALQAIQGSWGVSMGGWTKGGQCEDASGLTCSGSGMVEDLDLTASTEFTGFTTQTLPSALFNLTSLTRLRLTRLNLQGSIPEALGTLLHLQVIKLYNNNLTGPLPASLTNLDKLSILQMDFNGITSPVPQLATTMEHLCHAALAACHARTHPCFSPQSNYHASPSSASAAAAAAAAPKSPPRTTDFNDSVFLRMRAWRHHPHITWQEPAGQPPHRRHASLALHLERPPEPLLNLTTLRLHSNQLSGSIPTFLGELRALKDLTLHDTLITGTIPATLGGLAALKDFNVPGYLACPGNSTWCVVPQTNTTAFCHRCTAFCATCSTEAPPAPPVDSCLGVVCARESTVCENGQCRCADGYVGNATTGSCAIGITIWRLILIIVGSALALALLCLAAVWLYKRFFRSGSSSSGTHSMYATQRWPIGKSTRVGVGAWAESGVVCKEYPLKLVLKATNNWSQDNLLGSGGYGDVYRGVSLLDACTPWAVKRAKVLTNDFQKEVCQMSSKHHPHLVRLLGFAMGGNVRSKIEQVLIYELMPNGDLDKWMGKGTHQHQHTTHSRPPSVTHCADLCITHVLLT
ncbi:unnamed protein product [Closterium sp. Naga37s-1]|nr:unnamed protein product [Closterium sp. Naga37s-1]